MATIRFRDPDRQALAEELASEGVGCVLVAPPLPSVDELREQVFLAWYDEGALVETIAQRVGKPLDLVRRWLRKEQSVRGHRQRRREEEDAERQRGELAEYELKRWASIGQILSEQLVKRVTGYARLLDVHHQLGGACCFYSRQQVRCHRCGIGIRHCEGNVTTLYVERCEICHRDDFNESPSAARAVSTVKGD